MASNSPEDSFDWLDSAIKENRTYVYRNLRIFELMTNRHSFEGILSDEVLDKIKADMSQHSLAAARLFIDEYLKSKYPGKGQILKLALESSDNDLVRKILFEEDPVESAAHDNEQRAFDLHQSSLVNNISCDEMLISKCLSEGLITRADAEKIRAKTAQYGDSESIVLLLDCVKRARNFYSSFLKILWGLGYEKLVETIDPTEHEKLKARDRDGGSTTVNAISYDSDSYSSNLNYGDVGDDYILRNSSYPDFEKGDVKDLTAYNILPENNFNADGPVSSRTRSKTKVLAESYSSRSSQQTRNSAANEEHLRKTPFGFQSPQLNPKEDISSTPKKYPAVRKTFHISKQEPDQESSDGEESSSDRDDTLYPHEQQREPARNGSTTERHYKPQAVATHGNDKSFETSKSPKTMCKFQCQCGEICKDDIQLQVHSRSSLCRNHAKIKRTTSPEKFTSKPVLGFQIPKTISTEHQSTSKNSETTHHRIQSPPRNSETTHHRIQSPPRNSETTRHRIQSPPRNSETTPRRIQSPASFPVSSTEGKERRVFECKNCRKAKFLTQDKLESHMKTCTSTATDNGHSRYPGKENHASAEYFQSPSQPSGAVSATCTEMSVTSNDVPPERRQIFRCKCGQSFNKKEKLDKHQTQGRCEGKETSKEQLDSRPVPASNPRQFAFKCSKCSAVFSSVSDLKLHQRSKH